ncbi:MAG: hypothetical protein P4K94_08305 [Terracidiphilus sp.]|nr:hypothetical protein [Terracidiphilus sp.]
MHGTRLFRQVSATPAVLVLMMMAAAAGCKSTPSAPNANTQNPANAAGTAPAPTGAGSSGSAASAGANSNGGVASVPAPPPAPVRVTRTVQPGTDIHARITETINSKTANVGDPFSGVLSVSLTTPAGDTVFPKGTQVSGSVVSAKGQGRFKGAGVLAIELNEVGGHPVTATEYVVSKKGKGKRSAALIGGGAGGGALIGALAGGGKGALIGSLIGGGAGTAGAAFTGNKQLIIPSESIVVFELSRPLSVTVVK